MGQFTKASLKIKSAVLALVLVTSQIAGVALPFFATQVVHAAVVCTNDTAGANDVPGQKDLTQMCENGTTATTKSISWNWDDTGTSGNGQSLDACALFDINGNGNVDYAVCVSATGDPITTANSTVITYSCGDSKIDRCTSPATVIPNGTTTCTVGVSATNPFDGGNDGVATCTIDLTTVGGVNTNYIDTCSYPSAQPNSDPSDCIFARPKAGELNVVKHLIPVNDAGLFNLQIDAVTKAANISNNGTTGINVVSAGNHSVGETAGTATVLTDYTSAIECRDLNGTGTVVASGTGTSLASVPVADGTHVVCVITNTKSNGTVTLNKVITNQNGGTATVNDFGLTIGGVGVSSGGSRALTAGTQVAINESGLAGYSFVSITGTNCPSVLGGTVTVIASQNITCTINNVGNAPMLTIVKTVTNNNGGTKVANDFQGKIDGNNAAWSTPVTLSAGSHTASETNLPGYVAGTWGGDCAANGTITLALGQNATCTITNDDTAPSLTLNKIISNSHGGTASESNWTLTATGPSTISGPGAAGSTDVVSGSNFVAGTYTLSESGGPTGYSASAWTCTNGVTVTNNQITLANGQTTVCSITNSDIAPGLTILKIVNNPYGTPLPISNFPLFVDQTQVTSGTTNTQFNAGTHSVSETQQTGYTLTNVSGNCVQSENLTISVLLSVGGQSTCTLTNTATQPKLIVKKLVINDNGGTKTAGNFTMTVTGNSQVVPNFAGNENGTTIGLNEGSYSVDELIDNGYDKTIGTNCSGTIAIGETKTCTITNDDRAPLLRVTKHVINDNGGTTSSSDFSLYVNGSLITYGAGGGDVTDNSSFGIYADAKAGVSYTVSEDGKTGYEQQSISCVDMDTQQSLNHPVVLSLGQKVNCTITNNDIAPKLKLVKTVINNNGGSKVVADFPLAINGNTVISGQPNTLTAGVLYTATESNLPGYAPSVWGGDCSADGTITLAPADTKTCTITNDDIAPSLTLNKIVSNTHGGTANESDWTLTATGASTISGPGASGSADVVSDSNFKAGTYTLSESGAPTGYTASAWTCTNDVTVTNSQISLANGQTTVCTITNSDTAPGLTVNKNVVNPYGTPLPVSSFPLFVDQTQVTSGTNNTQFNAGSHTVSETQQFGYTLTNVSGDCTQTENLTISVLLKVGTQATCTLTNTAIHPKLIVKKHVINDNGGTKTASNFTMTVGGNSQPVPDFAGDENGTTVYLNEGNYSVFEHLDSGYAVTLSEDCIGTISVGQTKTCTITNDDIQPKLTVTKVVVNDNGGTKQVSDFPLFVNQTSVTSGTQNGLNAGAYTVSETNLAGYNGVVSGDCATNGTITLNVGDVKSCVITNNDVPATLIVKKYVNNNYSGDSQSSDFEILVNGTNVSDTSFPGSDKGTSVTLDAGSYSVNEGSHDGYTNYFSQDCSGTITVGETKTCYVTNNDIPNPSIHVVKSGPATAYEGDTVTYTFIVTNTGDISLNGIEVDDSIAGSATYLYGDTNNNNVLETTETWVYSVDYVIPTPQLANVENTVTVCGYQVYVERELGIENVEQEICGTDHHTLDVLHPAIKVVKSGPTTAKAGDTVTYTFTVTNTGDVALNDISVADSLTGNGTYVSGDTNNNKKLDFTETWIYTGVYKIPADQKANVKNTVDVCGYDSPLVLSNILDRISTESILIQARTKVCAQDKHTLSIPQVLAESTVLVNTGDNRTLLFSTIGAINIVLVIGALGFTRRRSLEK